MVKQCPKCGASAVRSGRSQMMRSLSENLRIYKYQCKSPECNWQSLVIPSSSKRKLRNYLLSAFGFIFVVGLTFRLFQFLVNATQE